MAAAKVLVVDDDHDLRETLGDAFEHHGHEVQFAGTGEEGVELCLHNAYDLVLMDVKLPGISGIDAFLLIMNTSPGAKVIVMTGFAADSELERARSAGAVAVMHKPLDLGNLVRRLQAGPSYP